MVNDLIENKPQRKYTFDHSFWSHDGFTNDETGYSVPNGPKYVDQKKVWNHLGTKVLEKATKGLNCTLFAYGQTGSGKSYSIFGYGANRGIVPMAGVELFNLITSNTDETVSYEIQIQMVEIYMEKLQDLLVKASDRKEEPQVRQNKQGVYVQGAKKKAVATYDEIQSTIDFGEKNRTIGATQMNATSSRSHTVITIQFTKKTNYGGKVA